MNARKSRRLAAAVMVVGALTVTTACSSGNSSDGAKPEASKSKIAAASVAVGTAADSTGPAIAEPNAKKGGTVNMIDRDDFSHLDPAQVYVNTNSEVSLLFTRQLTGYKYLPDGTQKLVGDLATDTGTTTDGGKTWKFTLKDGVKWQDGTAITSADIKYSIERTFAPFVKSGPTYIQQWLSGSVDKYREFYPGPYEGKELDLVQTPDPKTVVITFADVHPDANFTLAMTGYGVVPKAQDTKEAYDKKPFSSGPYQIAEHVTDKSLDLVRNPNWDPATDPIRNAYPDKWHMEFGVQQQPSTERFLADNGPDKTAFSFHNTVYRTYIDQVKNGDEKLKARTLQGLTPYVDYYYINNSRIKDQKVREALIRAFPHQQTRQLSGGTSYGDYATNYMSPTVLGYEANDKYDILKHPEGDPEAAKKLLAEAGATGQTIVYAFNNTPVQQQLTESIRVALEKAGFKFVPKPLDPKTYYDAIGLINNEYDLYWGGWGADWPTGYTSLQPWDGRTIADGASNYAHYNDPELNKAMDEAAKIADPVAQGKAWAAIDRKLQDAAASIPDVYQRSLSLYGSGLGGVKYDSIFGLQYPLNIYVK
ncbi:ABC transporter substrate-binding protein [Kitasatospora sp. CMC57]|uniref:ABC transporter substrate-binding protein n=1 Tax=Kitasatospora sp. CMC57 TaxID=3231513 RepID=A0AB33JT47_9ACTN